MKITGILITTIMFMSMVCLQARVLYISPTEWAVQDRPESEEVANIWGQGKQYHFMNSISAQLPKDRSCLRVSRVTLNYLRLVNDGSVPLRYLLLDCSKANRYLEKMIQPRDTHQVPGRVVTVWARNL
ncbi:hypothetical protein Pst134EB_023258 [Puccinia striiformis f. sp. tritici]|nr:hypothetical protein Pst134EB_023258 [Puccinia striiformis f. sp. tritici]